MMIKQHLALYIWIAMTVMMSNAAAITPANNAVPGGIARVVLPVDSNTRPVVHFGDKRVMVLQEQGQWVALVGLPLALKPGKQTLNYQIENSQASGNIKQSGNKTNAENSNGNTKGVVDFDVQDKAYETQHITIKDKRKVDPSAEDMKRIGREKGLINKAFGTWSEDLTPELDFVQPAAGPLSSPFGLRRFFNEQPRKPHSGMDIAAPRGTAIKAPAAGRVVETGDFFFNGNSVFIDHGNGLVTMYCHLDRIDVTVNQLLQKNDVIGTVGSTGRATGPHLHWSVSLNNSRVDPTLFLQ